MKTTGERKGVGGWNPIESNEVGAEKKAREKIKVHRRKVKRKQRTFLSQIGLLSAFRQISNCDSHYCFRTHLEL